MKLTKKQAISRNIELWEWLAETGDEYKHNWPEWEKKYGHPLSHCFLCEQAGGDCTECLIKQKFGVHCGSKLLNFGKWENGITKESRKKHAGLFLEQLRSL